MKVYFAIRHEGYESEIVFGPFAKRKVAADFIEKEEEHNEIAPWWTDDWAIDEVEIAEKWQDWNSLTYPGAKPYRPKYCTEQRRLRHEQWRKENPEKAAYQDQWMDNFMRFKKERMEPVDLLENLKFDQEIEVRLSKNDIIKIDN